MQLKNMCSLQIVAKPFWGLILTAVAQFTRKIHFGDKKMSALFSHECIKKNSWKLFFSRKRKQPVEEESEKEEEEVEAAKPSKPAPVTEEIVEEEVAVAAAAAEVVAEEEEEEDAEEEKKAPAKTRGRARKQPLAAVNTAKSPTPPTSDTEAEPVEPVKKRGRPRKDSTTPTSVPTTGTPTSAPSTPSTSNEKGKKNYSIEADVLIRLFLQMMWRNPQRREKGAGQK